MAKLGMETLGLVIVTDMPDVEPLVTAYVQAKLPKVKIIGPKPYGPIWKGRQMAKLLPP